MTKFFRPPPHAGLERRIDIYVYMYDLQRKLQYLKQLCTRKAVASMRTRPGWVEPEVFFRQIMGMLRLAPEIQEKIVTLPEALNRGPMTERILRPIGAIADQRDQIREFHKFLLQIPKRW